MTVRDVDIVPALLSELSVRLREMACELAEQRGVSASSVLRSIETVAHDLLTPRPLSKEADFWDRVFGFAEIAAVVGLSGETLRRLAYAGEIPVHRETPTLWWASRRELEAWTRTPGKSDKLVGVPAIAAVAGVCGQTIKNYLADPNNSFPARRVGGRWWASKAEVIAWRDGGGA